MTEISEVIGPSAEESEPGPCAQRRNNFADIPTDNSTDFNLFQSISKHFKAKKLSAPAPATILFFDLLKSDSAVPSTCPKRSSIEAALTFEICGMKSC
jgi:hypothetical protein